jgi:hypothetical protein
MTRRCSQRPRLHTQGDGDPGTKPCAAGAARIGGDKNPLATRARQDRTAPGRRSSGPRVGPPAVPIQHTPETSTCPCGVTQSQAKPSGVPLLSLSTRAPAACGPRPPGHLGEQPLLLHGVVVFVKLSKPEPLSSSLVRKKEKNINTNPSPIISPNRRPGRGREQPRALVHLCARGLRHGHSHTGQVASGGDAWRGGCCEPVTQRPNHGSSGTGCE